MDTDLTARLDRAIGPAPEADDDLAVLLARGHRTVRRRRLAATAGAVAAVALLLGGVTLAVGAGDPDASRPPVAQDPSASASPTGEPALVLARYDAAGNLQLEPDAEVLQFIDNPYDVPLPQESSAFRMQYRGTEVWCVAYQGPGSDRTGAQVDADQVDVPWTQWVQDQRADLVEER